jgi:hypothetical protein
LIPLTVTGEGRNADKRFEIEALIDSGAGGTFLDKKFAIENKIALTKIDKPIKVFNVDGTKNMEGSIDYCTWMKIQIGRKQISTRFLVTGLGKETMILGLPWLKQYNPKINWEEGTMDIKAVWPNTSFDRMLRKCIEISKMEVIIPRPRTTMEEIFEDIDHLPKNEPLPVDGPILESIYATEEEVRLAKIYYGDESEELDIMKTYLGDEEEVWIRAKMSISQELAHKTLEEKPKVELPEVYAEFRKVFEKEASERMPEHKAWDHAIDLKTDFIPKTVKSTQ